MNQLLSIILALTLILNAQVSQTGLRLEIDPADNPLNIKGQIGEANAFVGNVRLTARGGDIKDFLFLPSDLKRVNGNEVIGRQNVKLAGDPTLTMDMPKDFQVSVSGVEIPGEYQGQILFMLPGQAITETVPVSLKVTALAKPALTALPGSEQLKLRLVNCQGFDCDLARLFLPTSAFLNQYELQFDNPTQSDVTIIDTNVVGRGEFAGYPLTLSRMGLPATPYVLPAGKTGSITVTLSRDLIPPDHYTGAIYLTLQGRPERLTFPIDLNMRAGPFWAIVLLLIGIVLGRLFKYMQERGQPQSDALKKVYALEGQIRQAPAEDRKILLPMIGRVRQQVYREKLDSAVSQLTVIEKRLEALQSLRTIEESLKGKEQHPTVQEAMKKIASARTMITNEQDDQAKTVIDELNKNVGALATTIMGANNQPDQTLIQAATNAARSIEAAVQAAPLSTSQPTVWDKIKDGLARFSGISAEIRAETTYWIVRPLLYFGLLIGLLAIGLSALYVDKGLTFGANPFTDYFALVFWGLSSDVASRTIGNLQGLKTV
jgi:hypothetical protein